MGATIFLTTVHPWHGLNTRPREGATASCSSTSKTHLFQFTHPWGCDIDVHHMPICGMFQFTHPWGCDVVKVVYLIGIWVSIHAPVRVRQVVKVVYLIGIWVSIHAPVRVRLQAIYIKYNLILFQFTHPWGCDRWKNLYLLGQGFQFTHPWGCDF